MSPEVLGSAYLPVPSLPTARLLNVVASSRRGWYLSKDKTKCPLGLVVRTPSDRILILLSLSGKGTVRIF